MRWRVHVQAESICRPLLEAGDSMSGNAVGFIEYLSGIECAVVGLSLARN